MSDSILLAASDSKSPIAQSWRTLTPPVNATGNSYGGLSDDGRSAYICNGSNVYKSGDFGSTWGTIAAMNYAKKTLSSVNGQVVCTYGSRNTGTASSGTTYHYMYTSIDSGANTYSLGWSRQRGGIAAGTTIQDIAISADGYYRYAVGYTVSDNGDGTTDEWATLYVSFGFTPTDLTTYQSYGFYNAAVGSSIGCSGNGQYISVYSGSYGLWTYTQNGTSLVNSANIYDGYGKPSLSYTGKYIAILSTDCSSIYVSSNFGATFQKIALPQGGGGNPTVSVSPSGQNMVVAFSGYQTTTGLCLSEDFGATWRVVNTPDSFNYIKFQSDDSTLFGTCVSANAIKISP